MAKLNQHGLTDKQQVFADAYLCDPELNATKAYMAAYPKASPKSAKDNASRLIANDSLKKYIGSQQEARSKRTGIDQDWVLKRLVEEVEADILDLFDDENQLKPVKQWPKIWRQSVQFELVEGGNIKIKLGDRIRRIELIGNHIKIGAFGNSEAKSDDLWGEVYSLIVGDDK